MKTTFPNKLSLLMALLLMFWIADGVRAQNATVSTPLGIGKNCGGTTTTDSFRVLSYNGTTNQLSPIYKCKPQLGGGSPSGPAFSSSAGSVAYNPYDQNVYYIATTTGNNSFVYHWLPNTCHTSTSPKLLYSNYYASQFVVGLDFNPNVANEGYQLEFTGSASPYQPFLRKVNFTTSYFGPSDSIILSGGKHIYQQNGDIIFTPLGQLYFAFDNKLFQVDYGAYGTGHVNANFIDTLIFPSGYNLTGISYAQGVFIGSTQKNTGSPCAFKEIDISSGSAVISDITLPANNYTATDMATLINGIGVAKTVFSVVYLGGNVYQVLYDIKITDYGNSYLNNVQLVDSVKKVFGAAFVSASVAAVGSLPSGLSINSSYNGNTDCNIFVGGVSSKLNASPAETATVRVTVNILNPDINITYYNSAIGSAKSVLFPSISVSDSSNNDGALRADLNNNGIPDDLNEDIATPLRLIDWVFLPVRLIDFNGHLDKKTSVLQWALTNTTDRLEMDVQRSNDGINFKTISLLYSTQQTDIQKWNWTDLKPNNGDNYYRIKFTRNNGSSFYSGTIKIMIDTRDLYDFKISPVPFNQQLGFSFILNYGTAVDIKLIDNNLRIIKDEHKTGQKGTNTFAFNNLSDLPNGIYVLQIITNETTYSKTILKMN